MLSLKYWIELGPIWLTLPLYLFLSLLWKVLSANYFSALSLVSIKTYLTSIKGNPFAIYEFRCAPRLFAEAWQYCALVPLTVSVSRLKCWWESCRHSCHGPWGFLSKQDYCRIPHAFISLTRFSQSQTPCFGRLLLPRILVQLWMYGCASTFDQTGVPTTLAQVTPVKRTSSKESWGELG